MTVEEHARRHPEVWRRFSPRQTLVRYAWYVAIVFIVLWSVRQLEIPWLYFLDAHVQAADLLVRMFPPDWAFIEQVLAASFSRYDYDFALAILITIIALVFIGEFFSAWVRGKLR